MRFIYILFFAILISVGVSAGNSRTLEWIVPTTSENAIPDFKGSVHSGNQILPLFAESQTPEYSAAAFKVRLIYPVFEKLNMEELSQLRTFLNEIPDSIVVKVSIGIERKKQVLDLSFCPFVKKGSTYYKLISFNWDIKPSGSILRSASDITPRIAYVNASALSTGKWKKISVTETGMYKLTYSDIKGMGINPEKVQIYGYGGALLDEDFSLDGYSDDLPEVAVWKELGSDGVFNSGDYILFYAKGPVSWKYNSSSTLFSRVRNHYSDKAYYFVGERETGTKTTALSTFDGVSNVDITSFTDLILHESDLVNIGELVAGSGTGRNLYGEDFTANPSQTFNFDVPNLDTTQTSRAQVDFIAKNTGTSNCGVYVYNSWLANLSMPSIPASDNYRYANLASKVVSFIPKGKSIVLRIDYQKNGNSITHRACLDFITLNVRRFLKMSGSYLLFRDPKSVGVGRIGRFTIQNAGNKPVVFDVTNPREMVQMDGTSSGSDYIFNASASTLHEYVCADLNGTFSKPTIEESVTNQNLHGNSHVDMVIISPSEFTTYANTLASAHVSHDHLNVLVVTPEQVYNEFSSGTPDATAYRRMMKYYYDKAASDSVALPKYLLLFGDGVYDNRTVSTTFAKVPTKPNKILTYESVESLQGEYSYVTDDYFGFLDDDEGANLPTDKLDIGIGRFPVSTEAQAKAAVEKTINYMTNSRKGAWKNRLLFLADDGDEHQHTQQADARATTVAVTHPEFMINKIYIDAYPKVTTVSGSTVPDANNRFAELLNSGLLMVNYTGHGSTSQWAEEKLLTTNEITAMTNKCLPLWVTATCDFTRFDAAETSAGEKIFLNPNGGGIALFTTTRVVYATNNSWLNESFIDQIFSKNAGVRNTLGEIMNKSKGSSMLLNDLNKLKFALIGDPALKLAYPEYSAQVTQIDGKDISSSVDTIHALDKVTVSGKIYREDGTFAEDFNGLVSPTVLDAENVLTTWYNNSYSTTKIYERSKVLFSGKDSVRNGSFNFTFIVPKDISYSDKTGRINIYASDDSGENEAQGYFEKFVLTGTNNAATANHSGPEIELYLNDYGYISGEEVNETPTLIARISDEDGLNTSGNGIGHDLMLVVDGLASSTYKLNSYYMSDVGSYTSGVVQYVLPELKAGKHQLSFKAWDVQNNSNVDTLLFEVKPGKAPSVSNLNYAQKGERSVFIFNHDRPEVDVTVKLYIYDLLGRAIWETDWKMQASDNTSDTLEWNLTDTNGCRVQNGIYICKILLTDSNGVQDVGSKKIRVAAQ